MMHNVMMRIMCMTMMLLIMLMIMLGNSKVSFVIASSSIASTFHANTNTLSKLTMFTKISQLAKMPRMISRKNGIRKSLNEKTRSTMVNLLILISDTGGGHRASAEALVEALEILYPRRFNITVLDIWSQYADPPFNRIVEGYRYAAQRPWVWKMLFDFTSTKLGLKLTENVMSIFGSKGFMRAMAMHQPDVVVSMHPLCNTLPLDILRKWSVKNGNSVNCYKHIPFVTIVTDLGDAHVTWFNNKVDCCIVPTEKLQHKAIALRGFAMNKVIVEGLPVRSAFWENFNTPVDKTQIRHSLGYPLKARTALLLGGGDGVGKLQELLPAIVNEIDSHASLHPSSTNGHSHLIVVCGANSQLKQLLQNISWSTASVQVSVLGHVNKMHDLMLASDLIVTKAGPGTLTEALFCKLPVVISSFLPGQETGNVPLLVNAGCGRYVGSNVKDVARCVYEVMQNETTLELMSRSKGFLIKPTATINIARTVAAMVS